MAVPAQLPVLGWQSRSVLRRGVLVGICPTSESLGAGAGSGVSVSGMGTKTASGSGVFVGAVSAVHANNAIDARTLTNKQRIIILRKTFLGYSMTRDLKRLI